MAKLRVDGNDLVLELSGWEKVGSLHGDIRIPKSAVKNVKLVSDALAERTGFRAPGASFPGFVSLGTYRRRGEKDFVATYRHAPGVVLELEGAAYKRLVVTTPNGQAIKRALAA
jgi:hypothetical protein